MDSSRKPEVKTTRSGEIAAVAAGGIPQIKGAAFVSTFAFVDKRFGEAGRERLLEALAPDDRAVLGDIVMPITWYPLPLFMRFLRTMDRTLGRGDTALAIERGTFAAVYNITTTRKLILKLMTTQWIIERATGLWNTNHTSGRWTAEFTGPQQARATLHELGIVDEIFCATMRGWIMGLFQLASYEVSVAHTKCRKHGAPACVFETSWEGAKGPPSSRR